MENTELLNINAKEFALTDKRMAEIKKPFEPLADKYKTFIPELSEILKDQDVTEALVMKAKSLKLAISKVRIETVKVKKKEKDWVLQIWNAIQECHNIIVKLVEEKEWELDKIVKHFENLEIERKKELNLQRIELLNPYNLENIWELGLWEMNDDVFNAFLKNAKTEFEEKIEIQRKEDERIKKEKEDNEKMRLENEKLKKENEVIKENTVQKVTTSTSPIAQTKKELTERQKEYVIWKKENAWKFDIELKEEWKMVIYKKVWEFLI